ncbi:MAG: gamma-glutamylcyclotransferase family protein [Solirubrobacteraceae bacterium]
MLVFGYASLKVEGGRPARLPGWRRVWGVAMDNRVAIPGYKIYEDPATGERPAVHVAFLDIVEEPEAVVEGVLLEVADLAPLDARERNYDRVRVETDAGPAWTYVGSAAGRARFTEAEALVVDRTYLALVADAPPPPCPVVNLRRVDLRGPTLS